MGLSSFGLQALVPVFDDSASNACLPPVVLLTTVLPRFKQNIHRGRRGLSSFGLQALVPVFDAPSSMVLVYLLQAHASVALTFRCHFTNCINVVVGCFQASAYKPWCLSSMLRLRGLVSLLQLKLQLLPHLDIIYKTLRMHGS